jgi:hypothetical protein
MAKEEIKERLKVFDNFKFFSNDHHYEYKGKRVGISVTRLIEEYCNEFDSQAVAEKVALKQNKSVQEILDEWKYKNKFACEKGSTCHEYAQSLWSNAEYNELLFDGSIEYINAVNKIQSQAKKFKEDYQDKLEHLADEFVVGSSEFDIASAIDHLFINKLTGGLVLVDYKTNSDIHKSEKYAKKMKVPLQHLKDFTLNHYYIQLSIYKYLLERYAKVKVDEMFIAYMSENIENYEIIEIPYLKNEVEKILRDRREKEMGKCIPILIIGKSGSGKSTSLRNLKKEEYSLVNVLNKDLPFKNGRNIKGLQTKDYELVKEFIKKTPKDIVVIDDFGYIMTDKFVKKATETGYTKFSVIAQEFYNFVEFIKTLDGDKRVYLMMHEEKSDSGDIAPKTCGKMLDNQICVEGLFSILLRCVFDGKEHKFKTATDGLDVCKTPIDMFETEYIDNDLKLVDDTICEYYEINKNNEENKEEK